MSKGLPGSLNNRAVLTEAHVRAIRKARLIDRQPLHVIAQEFGSWPGNISKICRWVDCSHCDHDLRHLEVPKHRRPACTDPEVLQERRERKRVQAREAQRRQTAKRTERRRAARADAVAQRDQERAAIAQQQWEAKRAAGYKPHYGPVITPPRPAPQRKPAPAPAVTCADCALSTGRHWEPCSLDYPEATASGRFAVDCPAFAPCH